MSMPAEQHDQQPPPSGDRRVANDASNTQDSTHLRILSIAYFVLSGLSVLGALGSALYALIVSAALGQATTRIEGVEPIGAAGVIGIVVVICAIGCGYCLLQAAAYFFTGLGLQRCRWRVFCLIIAGLSCLNVPLGTVLGVFTIIVLVRPTVVEEFERRGPTTTG